MDAFESPSLEPVGGIITLVVVFLLRELVSGALKEIGKDAWGWAKARRSPRRPASSGDHPQVKVVRLKRHSSTASDDEAA